MTRDFSQISVILLHGEQAMTGSQRQHNNPTSKSRNSEVLLRLARLLAVQAAREWRSLEPGQAAGRPAGDGEDVDDR